MSAAYRGAHFLTVQLSKNKKIQQKSKKNLVMSEKSCNFAGFFAD